MHERLKTSSYLHTDGLHADSTAIATRVSLTMNRVILLVGVVVIIGGAVALSRLQPSEKTRAAGLG